MIRKENILGEPSRKNTAPCIAYISFKLMQKDPKASADRRACGSSGAGPDCI